MSKQIQLQTKEQTNTIPIKEFHLKDLVDHAAIMMIAKRASGKSWVIRAILHHYANIIPGGIVIAPTDKMSNFYGDFVPDSYIYYEFDSAVVEKILYRQQWIIDKQKTRAKYHKTTNTRAFLIMDDCLSSKGVWAKDKMISELLFNGRHYHIMYILSMQFPLGITPELRSNFDYIFLLADDTISNQKRIFDHYAGVFPNFESFRQVFGQLTTDYGCMVIINRGVRDNFLDKIMYYKAPDVSKAPVTIGGGQYNKFHSDNYNTKWRYKDNLFSGHVEDKFDRNRIKKNKLIVKKIDDDEERPRRR